MATYQKTFTVKRLWFILLVSMLIMFSVLLTFGQKIYQEAPPIPQVVIVEDGEILFTKEDIERGQNVWQALGGMQQGSIWGHGSYLAPDWSADWLHREALALIELKLGAHSAQDSLNSKVSPKEIHQISVQAEMRTNTYNNDTQSISLSTERAAAVKTVAAHYKQIFRGSSPVGLEMREQYAFPLHSTLSDDDYQSLSAFFFWTSWAAVTNRPNDDISYTSNWPHDPLVGNVPSASLYMWSFLSIVLLLCGIGALVWYYARQFDVWRRDLEPEEGFASEDRISTAELTPSMKATAKYFWTVIALFAVQILLGILTAHYQVEGQGLYGLPFVDYLPYAVSRTWHTQLSVLWIATSWLATGLYVDPLLSGHEPKFQRFGVNFLFISLLVIVVGSFVGQWLAVHGFISDGQTNFWLGHQGYEYVDLGRFWQIYLLVGLFLWVLLMLRALWPLLKSKAGDPSLVYLVVISTITIGLFYAAGLMWGKTRTSVSWSIGVGGLSICGSKVSLKFLPRQ